MPSRPPDLRDDRHAWDGSFEPATSTSDETLSNGAGMFPMAEAGGPVVWIAEAGLPPSSRTQGQVGHPSRQVDPDRSLDRQRLQDDAAARAANQDVGA